jgi:hypothetical protein
MHGAEKFTFDDLASSADTEKILDAAPERAGELERDRRGRRVLVGLDSADGLAGDARHVGKLLLRISRRLAPFAQMVFEFRSARFFGFFKGSHNT